MSLHPPSQTDLQARLWKEIEKARYGMLGAFGHGPVQHFQPMTAFCEPDNGQIWFFTRTDADLAKAAEQDVQALFLVQARDQGFHASIAGRLAQHFDAARMERYWNPVVSAWHPEGRADPRLTLLHLDATDAQVWLSETNPVAFAFPIARANAARGEPDLGVGAPADLGTARP